MAARGLNQERISTFNLPRCLNFGTEIPPFGDTLKETVNLDKVVVVTGFSELGLLGNSRT